MLVGSSSLSSSSSISVLRKSFRTFHSSRQSLLRIPQTPTAIQTATTRLQQLQQLRRHRRRRLMSNSTLFQAWRVGETEGGKFVGSEQTCQIAAANVAKDGSTGVDSTVVVNVTHSSLNYKDALSAAGNKGVTRSYPHTPGIDAAGTNANTGQSVLVTGYDLGMNTDGGFGEVISVPSGWVLEPNPFSTICEEDAQAARVSMVYGTAGLTAALCVTKLLEQGRATPGDGPVLVTGASGGVGSISIEILAKLGFEVVALSGKASSKSKLTKLGASRVVGRETLKPNGRPLLKPEYAHAIDTVGGDPLAELLKKIRPGGSVAACGNAAGLGLDTSVLPFILRGIHLLGVDSVEIPLDQKKAAWTKLANEWRCPLAEDYAMEIGRHDLDECLKAMLRGKSSGRVVLDHSMTL